MANEVGPIAYTTGSTIKYALFDKLGNVYSTASGLFAAPSGVTFANSQIALTESGTSGVYYGTIPAACNPDIQTYYIKVYASTATSLGTPVIEGTLSPGVESRAALTDLGPLGTGWARERRGEFVTIEFNSADASTAAAVSLIGVNGATRTLAATEQLIIYALTPYVVSGVTATIFDDIDADGTVDAGERIAHFGNASPTYLSGPGGRYCTIGNTPKVKASGAGAVVITGTGGIIVATHTDQR